MSHAEPLPPVQIPGVKTKAQFWKDLVERAANTFWQGALPVLVLGPTTLDWSGIKSLGIAAAAGGVGALLSAAKSWLARQRGVKNSASLVRNV